MLIVWTVTKASNSEDLSQGTLLDSLQDINRMSTSRSDDHRLIKLENSKFRLLLVITLITLTTKLTEEHLKGSDHSLRRTSRHS